MKLSVYIFSWHLQFYQVDVNKLELVTNSHTSFHIMNIKKTNEEVAS